MDNPTIGESGNDTAVVKYQGVKHTPGPWQQRGKLILADNLDYVCEINFPQDDPEVAANARLIAAAPDMASALLSIFNAWWDGPPDELDRAIQAGRVIAAKATGAA